MRVGAPLSTHYLSKMLLACKELLSTLDQELIKLREKIEREPQLALVWVGEDKQTELFVKAKQRKATELKCSFALHQFKPDTPERQLLALTDGLSVNKKIDGIVVQLPLPKQINTEHVINSIEVSKDVDGLTNGSKYPAPTAKGIVQLLEHNRVNPHYEKTVIVGAGRLVGQPLAEMFKEKGWAFEQINQNAEAEIEKIQKATLLISCTGQPNLIRPQMVNPAMTVIDGSGVDVDFHVVESLVKAITPPKGCIGPLTVSNLFFNLLTAVLNPSAPK